MGEELKQAIEAAKEQQPVAIDLEWYQGTIKLKDIKQYIRANINSASRSFVAIGYYLKYVRDNELFTEDGYSSIWEFAQAEFGISKSSASRFMAINDRFSKDGNSPILLDQYKDFSSSKLSEMLTLTDEQLEQVTLTTTVAEIREIKNPDKVVATSQQKTDPYIEYPELKYFNVFNKCIHQPEYLCILSETQKVAKGDGVDCNTKCCWNCPKHGGCGYECNSSTYRPNVNDIPETVKDISEDVDNEPEFANGVDVQSDPDETLEADIVQMDQEYDFDEISAYSLADIKTAIRKCQENLAAYKDCRLDTPIVKQKKMELDALMTLEERLYMYDMPTQERIQPEFPILRNNDQRKEWIDNYTLWPIWIDLKETGERYYRYDLTDNVAIVVKVSLRHAWEGYRVSDKINYGAEQYYLLGIKINYSTKTVFTEDDTRTFYECATNKTALVEYLKNIQKK